MITQPSDYKFVDFANGSMYTGGFNGNILPLRQDGERNIVKAEDIAFLHECIADKIGAFEGLSTENSFNPRVGPRLTPKGTISSEQILGIRERLNDELTREPTSGITYLGGSWFLSTPFEELKNQMSDTDHSRFDEFANYVTTHYVGHWTSSTSESDFKPNAPVALTPVELLFSDAKNLKYPIYAGVFIYLTRHRGWYKVDGTIQGGALQNLGWTLVLPFALEDEGVPFDTNSYCGYTQLSDTYDIASVPDTCLDDVELWMVYSVRNEVTRRYATQQGHESRVSVYFANGLINLTAHNLVTKVHANKRFYLSMSSDQSRSLTDKIANDCGIKLHRIEKGDITYQYLFAPSAYNFFLVGKNTRTKWWSD